MSKITPDIHDDPKYKESKGKVDEAIRAHADFVNEYANAHDESSASDDHLVTTGWILSIAVMGMNDEGEFDDTLYEANDGINNFMALGISTVQTKALRDTAMGLYEDDEDED